MIQSMASELLFSAVVISNIFVIASVNVLWVTDHHWIFTKVDPTYNFDRRSGGFVSIDGKANTVKSPTLVRAVAIQNPSTRIKLDMYPSTPSCLLYPSSCTKGLTVAMMLKIGSEKADALIFGPDGKLQADTTGVQVLYFDKELTVHINVQNKRYKWKSFIPKHRWFSLAFLWKPSLSILTVYIDKTKQETGYSSEDHQLNTTTSNSYYLGSYSNLSRYYDKLTIWFKEVSLDTIAMELWTPIEDNRGSTILQLSLIIPGIPWHVNYQSPSSDAYIQTKNELEAKVKPDPDSPGSKEYTSTLVESFTESSVSSGSILTANIKLEYSKIEWNHAYYFQTAIEDLLIGGAHVEIKNCVADDNCNSLY